MDTTKIKVQSNVPIATNSEIPEGRLKELGIVLGPVLNESVDAQTRKGKPGERIIMSHGEWHTTLGHTEMSLFSALAAGDYPRARIKARDLVAASLTLFEQLLLEEPGKPVHPAHLHPKKSKPRTKRTR